VGRYDKLEFIWERVPKTILPLNLIDLSAPGNYVHVQDESALYNTCYAYGSSNISG